jgi:hypothetical protein
MIGDVDDLAQRTRDLILSLFPDAVVTQDGSDTGFGTTTGYKGLCFVVTPHTSWVTLGISHGVGLPDPAGLMEGSGKVHRHVKIRSAADLARPELRDLLLARLALLDQR